MLMLKNVKNLKNLQGKFVKPTPKNPKIRNLDPAELKRPQKRSIYLDPIARNPLQKATKNCKYQIPVLKYLSDQYKSLLKALFQRPRKARSRSHQALRQTKETRQKKVKR